MCVQTAYYVTPKDREALTMTDGVLLTLLINSRERQSVYQESVSERKYKHNMLAVYSNKIIHR